MSEFDEFKTTYFEECAELLTDLEEQFAAIADGDRSAARLNAVFRAIHSIKGGAGAFGFDRLVEFAHAFESLLDRVRDGRVPLTHDVVALCIRANDIVADHVAAARNGDNLAPEYGLEEIARFESLASGEGAGEEPMEEFDIEFTPIRVDLGLDDLPAEKADGEDLFEDLPFDADMLHWIVEFTPHPALYARANDPLLLFRELAGLGELSVIPQLRPMPPLGSFDPFGVYCSWRLELVSDRASEESIREVFEFVDGDCDLVITAPNGLAAPAEPDAEPEPEEPIPDYALLDHEILASAGPLQHAESIEQSSEDAGLTPASIEADDAMPSLADLVATIAPSAVAMPVAEAPTAEALPAVETTTELRGSGVQSIRVDLDKVDRVVNMVGELVITQSMLTQQMDDMLRARYTELVRGLEVLAQTTRGLQDAVMAIRAQPVKSVFNRMPRLVRELAARTGKKIRLETAGEATEIDKTVVEQLSDPLTHMIRNSADHGIEKPEKRLAAGKPETGVIRLSAEQAGGNILIIVEDDGAGINRERVLEVARQRGVAGTEGPMTDEQIDNLIFAPGFSTASEISDISGRGVGMDVVLSNIKKIGGTVGVRSLPGRGTRMTLRLPLTLAVLDVMLVRVSGNPYVVPLSSIVETIQCERADFGRAPSGAQVLRVRGEYVQVIDLAASFGMKAGSDAASRFVVLCEAEGSVKVALLVDDIIGQQQVVIKSLETNFERIEGIAGGTILGDGNVALIIDVQGLKAAPTRRAA